MVISTRERLRHLMVTGTAEARKFTARSKGERKPPPLRNPDQHGRVLASELDIVATALKKVQEQRAKRGLGEVTGSHVTFEVILNPALSLDSLEDRKAGIERVAFKAVDGRGVVTVFVPAGKLGVFEAKLAAYLDPGKMTKKGKRYHEALLNSIEQIRRTVLQDLWTDPDRAFPTEAGPVWWELWLRNGVDPAEAREQASRLGIIAGEGTLSFLDRTVILVRASLDEMVLSVDLLDAIAELRSARSLACELLEMQAAVESEKVRGLGARIGRAPTDAPAVCILDTGVDVGHPLLEPGLVPESAHSYNPDSWGVDDRHGHGTEMAGFALFGDDLEEILLADNEIDLRHQLESVKILRAPGTNPPELYGEITLASAARAEIHAPYRRRVFSLSVTDPETRSPAGEPTSWSAALDLLASGGEEGDPPSRLAFVSAGNADRGPGYSYPDSNHTDRIHDPGQAWNAVTVGAYTERDLIHETDYCDWQVVAPGER